MEEQKQPRVVSIKYGYNAVSDDVNYVATTDAGFDIVNEGNGSGTWARNSFSDTGMNGNEFVTYLNNVSGNAKGLDLESYLEGMIDIYEAQLKKEGKMF